MLQTHASWEKTFGEIGLLHRQGIRWYPRFEVALDTHLFHVEVRDKKKKRSKLSRFIYADLVDVLPLLKCDALDVRVFVQSRSRDTDDGEYYISAVSEIIEAKDSVGQPAHLYRCKNGKTYVRSLFAGHENELTKKMVIYQRLT